MSPLLSVKPRRYQSASKVFGDDIAGTILTAGENLTFALAALSHMAGSDPAGITWAAKSNPVAVDAVTATERAINACFQLARLLWQTGYNHSLAESSSGGMSPGPLEPDRYADREVVLGLSPVSAGGSGSLPAGWSLVSHLVCDVWPDGHQDQLRQAANAWSVGSRSLAAAAECVPGALAVIRLQQSPETDDVITVCCAVREHLNDLAWTYDALARACSAYAHELDRVHAEVTGELRDLIEWTAGTEVVGGLLAFASLGASELFAQGVETGRIARAAARISMILARIGPAALRASAHLAEVVHVVADVSIRFQSITDRSLVTAPTEPAWLANSAEFVALGSLERPGGLPRRVIIGGPKMFDPWVLKGVATSDVRESIPTGWDADASSRGSGVVYSDPAHRGRGIRLMPGYPWHSRPDPVTWGPYAVVSQNGDVVKVPLMGNPTL